MSEANKVGTHGSCVRGSKPQRINLNSVPEPVEGPEPLPLRFGDAFKAYALRGIFVFPR